VGRASTPVKIDNSNGDLTAFQEIDERYLAYEAGLHLSLTDSSSIGSIAANSLGATGIGAFTNTIQTTPVGGTALDIQQDVNVYNYHIKDGAQDKTNSNFRGLVGWEDSAGGVNSLKEFDDNELYVLANRLSKTIIENEYPGTYRVASSSPGADWTIYKANAFVDTRIDGTSTSYNFYIRTTGQSSNAPTTTHLPASLKRSGGNGGTYQGIQRLNQTQLRETLGEKVKQIIAQGGVGRYQIRSATEGAPVGGTWVSLGNVSDTRQEVAQGGYTSAYAAAFEGNYTNAYLLDVPYTSVRTATDVEDYTAEYTGDFTSTSTANYISDFIGDYSGLINYQTESTAAYTAAFTGNYTSIRNYVTTSASNSVANFTGNYVGNYIASVNYVKGSDFVGDYAGAVSYQRNSTATVAETYTRNRTQVAIENYTGNFAGNYLRDVDFQSTRTATSVGDYVGNFVGNYLRDIDYQRNSTATYAGDYVGDYVRDIDYQKNSTATYAGNYVGDYVRDVDFQSTRVSYYSGNYTGAANYTANYVGNYYNFSGTFAPIDTGGSVDSTYGTTFGQEVSSTASGNWGLAGTDAISPSSGGSHSNTLDSTTVESKTVSYSVQQDQDYIFRIAVQGNAIGGYVSPLTFTPIDWHSRSSGSSTSGSGNWKVVVSSKTNCDVIAMHSNTASATPAPFTATEYFSGSPSTNGTSNTTSVIVANDNPEINPSLYFLSTPARSFVDVRVRFRGPVSQTNAHNVTLKLQATADLYDPGTSTKKFSANQTISTFSLTATSVAGAASNAQTTTSTVNYAGIKNYIKSFAGNYVGNYVRAVNFAGDYIGNYTGDFTGNYVRAVNFASTRVTNYTGDFTGNYVSAVDFASTRATTYSGDYIGNFLGNYVSAVDFASTRATTYSGNYTGDFAGDYVGNYTGDFLGEYVSDQNFAGNYAGTRTYTGAVDNLEDYTRNSTVTYTGNFTGDYAGATISTRTSTINYTGNFTGDYINADNYQRTVTVGYTNEYVGNYVGATSTTTYSGNYIGDFAGDYVGTIPYETTYISESDADYTNEFTASTVLNTSEVIETYTLYARVA